jgi:iron complex transport system permease protein
LITYKKLFSILGLLFLILLAAFFLGLGLGSVRVPVLKGLMGAGLDSTSRAILWELRLPRVILAGIVGWSLSTGGVVFQALMRNPLAEPFLLGVSSGAGVSSGSCFGGGSR